MGFKKKLRRLEEKSGKRLTEKFFWIYLNLKELKD